MQTKEKILFVDDNANLLQSLKRQLRNSFNVDVALSGKEGLQKLQADGPFAVVVSDMRMPEMDGIDFLKEVRERDSSVVRIMLTGNADQNTAVLAVNDTNIFRFLNKPCDKEIISKALQDAIVQHRLIAAEKDLLENTLNGSMHLLCDILSLVDSATFGKTTNIREPIRMLAAELGAEDWLDIDFATMLCEIGAVALPPNVAARHRAGEELTEEEQKLVERIPEIGRDLLKNIPRLEKAAEIVYYSQKNYDGTGFPNDDRKGKDIPLGSRLIKLYKALYDIEIRGRDTTEAIRLLVSRSGEFDPNLIKWVMKLFCGVEVDAAPDDKRSSKREPTQELQREVEAIASQKSEEKEQKPILKVSVAELEVGQLLVEDLFANNGILLLGKGHLITRVIKLRVQHHHELVGVKEPIVVQPKSEKTKQ